MSNLNELLLCRYIPADIKSSKEYEIIKGEKPMSETITSKIFRLIREGNYKEAHKIADENGYLLKIKMSGIELKPMFESVEIA